MTPAHGDLQQATSQGIADKTCSLHFSKRGLLAIDHHFHSRRLSFTTQYLLGMCAHKPSRISQADIGMCMQGRIRITQVDIGMCRPRLHRPSASIAGFPRSSLRTSQGYIGMCVQRLARISASSYCHVRSTQTEGEIPLNRYFPPCPGRCRRDS